MATLSIKSKKSKERKSGKKSLAGEITPEVGDDRTGVDTSNELEVVLATQTAADAAAAGGTKTSTKANPIEGGTIGTGTGTLGDDSTIVDMSLIPTVYEEPVLTQIIVKRYNGEKEKGLYEGEGEAFFKMSHHYQGNFTDGKMHGKGTYTWVDGTVYEGDFDNNHIAGKGVYRWLNGSTYDGEVLNGLRHGFGTFQQQVGKSSVSYTGEWKEGKKHGKGRMDYDSEGFSFYEGDWVYNVRHGYGSRQYPSGNFYQGMWYRNIRHGEGTMRWLDSDQLYTGQWKHGIQEGVGQQLWFLQRLDNTQYALRNMYDGQFVQGYRHGYGVFYYANGACYEGEWENNMKNGKGKFTFKNGRIYEGLFDKDHIAEFPQFEMDGMNTPDLTTIRTRTPLPADQMSVQSNGSRNTYGPSFQLDIDYLLSQMPDANIEEEGIQVVFVLMRHTSMLKRVYHFYSCLGFDTSPDNTYVMNRMQFWRFLKDCRLHHSGSSLMDMDRVIAQQTDMPADVIHYPYAKILFREFTNHLIALAHHIYASDYKGAGPMLACSLSKLINDHILCHACTVKSYIYNEKRRALNLLAHIDQAYVYFKAFSVMRKRTPIEPHMTMRHFLLLLKDLKLINTDLTAKAVVDILAMDDPNVTLEEVINLEREITFLEFFEALVGCAEVYSTEVVVNQPITPLLTACSQPQSVTSIGSASRPITQSALDETPGAEGASTVPIEAASESLSGQQKSSQRTGKSLGGSTGKPGESTAVPSEAVPPRTAEETGQLQRSDLSDENLEIPPVSVSNQTPESGRGGGVLESAIREMEGRAETLGQSAVSFAHEDELEGIVTGELREGGVMSGADYLDAEGIAEAEPEIDESTRQFNFWLHQIHLFFSQKFFPACQQWREVLRRVANRESLTRYCPPETVAT